CRNSVATPLVQIENVLSALPLLPDELETLHAPPHSVVFAAGGIACLRQLSSTSVESPEKWLDVSAFKVVEVTSLGAAFAEPKIMTEPQPFDARAKLDGVPAEASELRETIAAIKSASGDRRSSRDWSSAEELLGWLGRAFGLLSFVIGR